MKNKNVQMRAPIDKEAMLANIQYNKDIFNTKIEESDNINPFTVEPIERPRCLGLRADLQRARMAGNMMSGAVATGLISSVAISSLVNWVHRKRNNGDDNHEHE
jgi:hypothetical protein